MALKGLLMTSFLQFISTAGHNKIISGILAK